MGYLAIHFEQRQDVDQIAYAYSQVCSAFHVHDEWHDYRVGCANKVDPTAQVVIDSIEDARTKLGRALYVSLELNGEKALLSGSLHSNGLLISVRHPLTKSIRDDEHVQIIVRTSERLVPESRVEIVE